MRAKFSVVILVVYFSLQVWILFADPKGESVMRAAFDLPDPQDSRAVGMMVIEDTAGNRRTRRIVQYTQDTPDGQDSYIEVQEPADVAGMRFLTLAEPGEDVQRMYLPALDSARRISGSAKKGRFLGSDLFFYDMEDHKFEDFSGYRYLRSELFRGHECDVVEAVPTDDNAPYSRMIQWVSRRDHYIYKMECYAENDSNRLFKTIISIEVGEQKGILYPVRQLIENHRDNHKTALMYQEIEINTGVSDDMFSVRYLER